MSVIANRMHRHTRPSAYMDRAANQRNIRAQRPGGHNFSFTGEFPDMMDTQPVMATERRRDYTSPVNVGGYQALGSTDAVRVTPFTKHGVALVPAVVITFAVMILMAMCLLMAWSNVSETTKSISDQQMRMTELTGLTADAEYEIAQHSNDVNIRKEAVRLGLINSKGVDVTYLTAPETANFSPDSAVSAQLLGN